MYSMPFSTTTSMTDMYGLALSANANRKRLLVHRIEASLVGPAKSARLEIWRVAPISFSIYSGGPISLREGGTPEHVPVLFQNYAQRGKFGTYWLSSEAGPFVLNYPEPLEFALNVGNEDHTLGFWPNSAGADAAALDINVYFEEF